MTDASVEDYPDTGCYIMSPGKFEALDTQLAWSAVEHPEPPHHVRAMLAVG
jgi:hypothetical protein